MATRAFSMSGAKMQRTKEGGDLVVEMAFASDKPYERWWGVEILDMSAKSVRLGRLNDGDGGPVLYNHNWDDLRGRHVPGSVRTHDDGMLRGQIIIPAATGVTRDTIAMVESRTLSKASVGYQIHRIIEQTTAKTGEKIEREIDGATFERLLDSHAQVRDGRVVGGDLQAFHRALDQAVNGSIERKEDAPTVYRVVDWEPLENSLVTIPADNSVGVGRMAAPVSSPAAPAALSVVTQPLESSTMKVSRHPLQEQANDGTTGSAGGAASLTNNGQQTEQRAQSQGQNGQAASGNRAVEMEQSRRRGIENLCKANKIDDNIRAHWIGTGLSVEEITEDLLKILEKRGNDNPRSEASLGLSDGETQRYSLFRAVRAVADKNWSSAGFELECSRTIAKRLNVVQDPNKFYVPFEVQQRQVPVPQKRDLTAGTTTAGGFLVATENMSFIEVLRNRSVAYRMGARRLSGLVGNVTVPRQTGQATAVWLANEASTITESQQVFAQMALSPKTVGAYTEISRQLLLQSSPDAESIVTADLGAVAALAVDLGVLSGSGAAGQPTGINNTAGIGAVTGTTLGYAGILEFQTDVASANVMPVNGGYVTTPSVAALMMQRQRFSSTDTPLWQGNIWDGQMAGFNAMSSLQMAAATMLFGDWAQVIVAEWGVLEVEVNPYANFQAGIIGVRAIVSMDVGLRYPAAFSLAGTIT